MLLTTENSTKLRFQKTLATTSNIQDHRSAIHAYPAALEELETRDTEENDDEQNDDDGNDYDGNDYDFPVLSDREDDPEDSEEDGEEQVEEAWEEFKRIQESFENKMKSFLHDKNFRKSFIKYTKNVQKVSVLSSQFSA